jgi:hypothetical protein
MRPWLLLCALILLPARATAGETTPAQQVAFADEAIGRMKANARGLRARLGGSPLLRTTPQATCVHARLTQLEVLARQAEDARSALRRASLREDMDAMAQASSSMARLDARANEVEAAVAECNDVEPLNASFRDERITRERRHAPDGAPDLDEAIAGAQVLRYHTPATGGQGAQPAQPARPGGALSTPSRPPSVVIIPDPAAPFPPAQAPSGSPYAAEATHEASMLAYSADLTLAVSQVDRGVASVEALARELGGYLAQQGDDQVSVRVPRPRFDEAISRIAALGDVLHRNVAAEDVTDEYVDLELRLKNARAMRDQLAMLLQGAPVKDAVEIEKELAKVTEVIEHIEGRLKVLRDRVGYSSITVSFVRAHAPAPVRSTAILPFAWLDTMGLDSLLRVPTVSP